VALAGSGGVVLGGLTPYANVVAKCVRDDHMPVVSLRLYAVTCHVSRVCSLISALYSPGMIRTTTTGRLLQVDTGQSQHLSQFSRCVR